MNGTTWQEQLTARLEEAKAERAKAESEAQYWITLTEYLERLLQLERDRHSVSIQSRNGVYTIDAEGLRKVSTRQALIRIAVSNNGLLVTKDAFTLLMRTGIFTDEKHARSTIFSTLGHSKKSFKKERPGIYRLTEYGRLKLNT